MEQHPPDDIAVEMPPEDDPPAFQQFRKLPDDRPPRFAHGTFLPYETPPEAIADRPRPPSSDNSSVSLQPPP